MWLSKFINISMAQYFDYIRSCYDLVVETEGKINVILEHEIEAYVVHLMASNFTRTDIGTKIIAIELLTAVQNKDKNGYKLIGDECLLIHSFPVKKQKWPSPTYYQDMGMIAYGYCQHIMENNFIPASRVISAIFNKSSLI